MSIPQQTVNRGLILLFSRDIFLVASTHVLKLCFDHESAVTMTFSSLDVSLVIFSSPAEQPCHFFMSSLSWKKVQQVFEPTCSRRWKAHGVFAHVSEHATTKTLSHASRKLCSSSLSPMNTKGNVLFKWTWREKRIDLFCFVCRRDMILSVFIKLPSEFTLTLWLSQTARRQICPLPNDLFI